MKKMKKLKKIFWTILLGILIIVILCKVYHLFIAYNTYKAIEKFKSEENRYYSVEVSISGNIKHKESIYFNHKIVKCIMENGKFFIYHEWSNFETGEKYSFDVDNKILYNDDSMLENRNFVPNLPNLLTSVYRNNKIDFSKLLEIRYIVPTKYNEKSCYKISTRTEMIIIDKSTYLPLYSTTKMINSQNKKGDVIENIYEFKVNEVTDEDVALPDFSDYTIVDEKIK